jgi:hypothetical protein
LYVLLLTTTGIFFVRAPLATTTAAAACVVTRDAVIVRISVPNIDFDTSTTIQKYLVKVSEDTTIVQADPGEEGTCLMVHYINPHEGACKYQCTIVLLKAHSKAPTHQKVR